MEKHYEDFQRLEAEQKQLVHTKDELLRQRRRQLQDEEWKKKIDSEFEERNKKLEKDMSEKQRAAEWLQAIHKAIELIRSKKNKKGKKRVN